MPWINPDTGELAAAECPHCGETKEWAENQVRGCELELRRMRSAVTRMKNEMEAAKISKRDGAVWADLLACWLAVFPTKRPTATGIRSARATAVFERLNSGADVETIKNAIAGATRYPYLHYGRRAAQGDTRADDLQEIVSLGNDGNFDFLVSVGAELRAGRE